MKASDVVSVEALDRFTEDWEPALTTSQRIVLTLRWFDWVSASGLREAYGLDAEYVDRPERTRFYSALRKLVKRGIVEERSKTGRIADPTRAYRLVRNSPKLPLRLGRAPKARAA